MPASGPADADKAVQASGAADAEADRQGTAVEVGGLTRSDAAGGFEIEFEELASEIMQEVRGGAAAAGQSGGEAATAAAKGE